MMAKILRGVILVFVGIASFWACLWWENPPVVAIVGALLLLGGFVPLLGVQFLIIWKVNQRSNAPAATLKQLTSAWWAEVKLTVSVFVVNQAFRENRFVDQLHPENPAFNTQDRTQDSQTPGPNPSQLPGDARKQRGVLFIHGFLCNRGFWNPWVERLQQQNIAFVTISLEPVFGSIDGYSGLIEPAVQQLTLSTGLPPLLICHSMGGLAARAWLRANPGGDARVSHIVTIGTPHHGTCIVQHPSFAENATQMQKNSVWVTALAADELTRQPLLFGQLTPQHTSPNAARLNPYANFTCYYSNCDNIVFPTLTATLDGADNRFVPGQAHVQMAFDETVMRESLARL